MRNLTPSQLRRLRAATLVAFVLALAVLQIPAVAEAVAEATRETKVLSQLALNTLTGKLAGRAVRAAEPPQQSLLWPTLTQQLAAANVRPGSALEQLIRANQDFSLLRPDEASDVRGLPPWLRVWWRKAHPELKYTAEDPTGGYPLVLKEILEWMEWHQDLRPGNGVFPEGEGKEGEEEAYERTLAPNASITGEQRISGLQVTARSESDIRINFFDPSKILSGSNNINGTGQQAMFYSTNAGATWSQTQLPLFTGDSFQSDPTVDWTSDGRGWSSTLGINSSVTVLRFRNYFTSDNGATWTFEATPSGTQTSVDKQMVWVDHSATSPFFNRMYAIWHNGTPAFMNRRTAGASGTWLASPLQVSGAETSGTAIGSDVKTNSAGDVFGFWPTTTGRRIFVVKSTNGGDSFGTPVQIGTTFDGYDIGVPAFNNRRALIYISGGAYRTANKNLVYAAWTDLSGETGCTQASNEPGSNVASTCKTRIWFSRSTDGGTTWAAPVKLNNQASANDQFNQWLAVDETSGALGVIYYDTVADSGRKKTHVYYQRSFDDGVTWSNAQQVTTGQTDETTGGQDSGNQYGDYNGLSAYAGVLFPSWTDRRAGAREEIWTARISDPTCTAPGTPTLTNVAPTAPNQITVSWTNGSPASTSFKIYRANGTCAAPGAYTLLASGVTGTSFNDTTVSGGSSYSYKVSGVETTGACESAQSSCGSATATGSCTLPPTFNGLSSVTNNAQATCSLNLNWTAALSQCASAVNYRIYRSASSSFTPSAGNLIATVSGTTYTDSSGLNSGVPYFYIVRAVDNGNGNADTNTIERSGTPTGPISVGTFTDTFEGTASGGGFDNTGWTKQVLTGTNAWTWSTIQVQTPTHSWFSPSQGSAADRVLVSPSLLINANSTLTFWHTYAFEGDTNQGYDGGTLEYSVNGGAWSVVPEEQFTAGGYTGTINGGFSNPLGGLRGWVSGAIGPMTQVSVNLNSFAGQSLRLRWHAGDDSSTAGAGWYVDSITLTNAGVASSCSVISCPTITLSPTTLPAGNVGVTYNQTITASGGAAPYTFALNSGSVLPTGLTLSTSGVLSGTLLQGGAFTFNVTATDANGCTGGAQLALTAVCPTITVTPTTLPQGTVGTPYNQTLTANGGLAPYAFALAAGSSLPSGLTLSAAGVLSGTPMASGTFSFTVSSTDSRGCAGNTQLSVTIVCPTISVTPTTLPQGTVGQPYSQPLAGNGGTAPYTFALANGSTLPSGLTLNANGTLSGTLMAAGTTTFTVNTTDSKGCTGSGTLSLTVVCPTISLTPTTLPSGRTGSTYSQPLSGTGGTAPYTFVLANGSSLPAGLTLATNGLLSGIPTAAGTFNFTVNVSDSKGCTGSAALALTVVTCPTITVNPATLTDATVGTNYSQIFTQTGGNGAITFSLTGTLPTGLSFTAATATLAGTPTQFGSFPLTVTATDANGCAGSRNLTLVVNCPTITVNPTSLPNAAVGTAYSQIFTASPVGTYSYSVTSGALPPGLSLTASNGTLAGFPTAPGNFSFTITATGAGNCTGTRSYSVTTTGTARARLGDFDGDGKTDLSVWRGAQGSWLVINSSTNQLSATPWGQETAPINDAMVPGDYDGDGKIDLAVFRRLNGHWYILRSSDGAVLDVHWGYGTDTPVPADYDGDGKTDIAVWRGSDSNWYIRRSSDLNPQVSSWGASYAPYNDLPVPADYDGDGKADIAVFRRQTGVWYIQRSSDNGVTSQAWGIGGDTPVQGDYDGDGKADIAIWRGGDTRWYILKSSNGAFQVTAWGSSAVGDVPVPGDYDGDNKLDIAVWRAPEGRWYSLNSSDGAIRTPQHGQTGDTPIPVRLP